DSASKSDPRACFTASRRSMCRHRKPCHTRSATWIFLEMCASWQRSEALFTPYAATVSFALPAKGLNGLWNLSRGRANEPRIHCERRDDPDGEAPHFKLQRVGGAPGIQGYPRRRTEAERDRRCLL